MTEPAPKKLVASPAQLPRSRKWLVFALACMFSWGIFGLLSKLGSGKLAPGQMQMLFTCGTLPLMAPAWWRARKAAHPGGKGLLLAMLTGSLAAFANLALFAAMKRGPASIVAPVTALYPMVTIFLAALVLRERMNRYQYCGVAMAIAAIFLLSS